jgi:hypothetical protein
MTKYLLIGLTLLGLLLPHAGYTDFNLDDCYGDCRGMDLRIQFGQVAWPGTIIPVLQGNYDACMQKCDQKFWAQFDKKTQGVKQKDKTK